ncbi:helix-turn-helix domain-containing protein [Micromonospora sp. CA-246542]|uniref:helix-turn-helix domain-containing protein n=1 Tax=Micromonospora sp. CA-246542 TaxID=3239959 RepID=UPI003D8BD2DE
MKAAMPGPRRSARQASSRRGWEYGADDVVGRDSTVYVFNGGVEKVQLMAAAAAEDVLDPETARQQLSEVLTAARVTAGKPKLARLARDVGYSESMLSRVFNGHLAPSRELLDRLAEHMDVETRTFTSVWVPLWAAASRKTEQKSDNAVPQTGPPGAPSGFECPACGSWVTNPKRHIEWHMTPDAGWQGGSVTPLRPVQ